MPFSLFGGRPQYDRKRLLDAAAVARRKGRVRRAVRLYRQVLAAEPQNAELHARLAPLLAARGQHFDAWRSYQRALGHLATIQKIEPAVVLAREATGALPRCVEAWETLARLERDRDNPKAALEALMAGRRALRGRRYRPQAIALLRRARELDPGNEDIAIDLARLLHRNDQKDEALLLLDKLFERSDARGRRRARGAQWRIETSLLHTWRYLQALIASLRDDPHPLASRPRVRAPR